MTASRSRQRSMRIGPEHGYIRGMWPGGSPCSMMRRGTGDMFRGTEHSGRRFCAGAREVRPRNGGRRRPAGWTSRSELSSEVDTSEIHRGAP
jgi:hypothetical protein